MKINNTTALVTGAGRGLGREFVRELLARGAKVYATGRDVTSLSSLAEESRVTVLPLDVTDPSSVAAAAEAAGDVDLLVNNAGVFTATGVLGDLDKVCKEMEVNYWGVLYMVRAFADVLARNDGGAILNVVSDASWSTVPGNGAYAASKAAAWNLSNALRHELAKQATLVTAVHLGATDTDMLRGIDIPKGDPADVVRAALDGVEAGEFEVLADEAAASMKAALNKTPEEFYPELARMFRK
ncbi:SDR family oxidoreductase [Streptomonospora sediminis]